MSESTDLDLLRRHEPILRFTDGELFFPMAAGSYVEACELLTGPNLREARVSIPAGELDLERLAAVGDPLPGSPAATPSRGGPPAAGPVAPGGYRAHVHEAVRDPGQGL